MPREIESGFYFEDWSGCYLGRHFKFSETAEVDRLTFNFQFQFEI